MKNQYTAILLIICSLAFVCCDGRTSSENHLEINPSLGCQEVSVIETLLMAYSHDGPNAGRPALSSYIASSSPEEIGEVSLDYSRTINSSYLTTLRENAPEWLIEPEPNFKEFAIHEALDDLVHANQKAVDTRRVGKIQTVPMRELNDAILDLEAEKGEDFWHSFETKFPKSYGYSTVSRVGFSSDRTVAVVYFSWTGEPTSGLGCIHILQSSNGEWRLVGRWRRFGWTS